MPTHLPQPTPGLTSICLFVMEGLSWKFGRTRSFQLDLTSIEVDLTFKMYPLTIIY